MKRTLVATTISIAFAALAFAQAGENRTETQASENKAAFEAADVHAAPVKNNNQGLNGPSIRHGNFYQIRFATLSDLIRIAYGLSADKIVGGPSWLEYDTFDVTARMSARTTVEAAKPMLQALLADRFKLVTHKDTRPLPAFSLKAAKRNGLKQSDGSQPSECKFIPPTGPPAPGEPLLLTYNCHNMTMAGLAEQMPNFAAANFFLGGQSVVDQTELKGAWDFDFQYTPRNMGNPNGPVAASISLADALAKLGLRLEPGTVPLAVLLVDSASQPAPNPPNIAELLHSPPPPTEFEVAEIKPTDPNHQGTNLQILPGGRVNVAGAPMKLAIQQLWNVSDDMLVGLPKWAETERFDIVAKAPGNDPDIDTEDLIAMLKALLVERFSIKLHTEERSANAYTLTAVKPKMKKADPTSRTRWKEGPAVDGKDPRDKTPALSRLVTVQNMTMAQFADKLQFMASGYIRSAVLDLTGLEGGWDFTLNFSPIGLVRPPGVPPPGRGGEGAGAINTPDGASDPNGAISLFDAIEKQLGLKLQQQKRPVQVLVIDHIEQKPLDN